MAKRTAKKTTWKNPQEKSIASYDHKRVAVKIIDDWGIERLKIVEVG